MYIVIRKHFTRIGIFRRHIMALSKLATNGERCSPIVDFGICSIVSEGCSTIPGIEKN